MKLGTSLLYTLYTGFDETPNISKTAGNAVL